MKQKLKERRVYWGSQFEGTAHSERGGTAAGERGGWSHWVHSEEAEREECYSSACFLFVELRTLATEGATMLGADLPTLVRVGRRGEGQTHPDACFSPPP